MYRVSSSLSVFSSHVKSRITFSLKISFILNSISINLHEILFYQIIIRSFKFIMKSICKTDIRIFLYFILPNIFFLSFFFNITNLIIFFYNLEITQSTGTFVRKHFSKIFNNKIIINSCRN